jgi:hypothetical protein
MYCRLARGFLASSTTAADVLANSARHGRNIGRSPKLTLSHARGNHEMFSISYGVRIASILAVALMLLTSFPGKLAAQGQPVETASHMPVALWFIGAAVLGVVLAYGIMRNRRRTRAEKQMTEQATRDLYGRENRKG